MAGAVDWEVARRVANRVAGREPFAQSYHYDSLEPDFTELTKQAEELVGKATGLRSLAGPARARVADRSMWIDANLASFQRLLRPLLKKMDPKVGKGALGGVARRVSGAELGMLLGWMSTRVLGQYDLLVVEDEHPDEQDIVYYVGPNVLMMEKRYAFPPREFRLWLALHEVTHRAQFTGIPWLRGHFLSLVDELLSSVEPDPQRLLAAIHDVLEKKRAGRDPLSDGGVMGILATPEQKAALEKVSGMMSLLEGHGDITMDRAGAGLIPNAERFGRVLRQRRQQTKGLVRLLQRLVGIEAKLQQYAQGEAFITAVEAAGGPALLDRAFERPENLPTITEIRNPSLWLNRMSSPIVA
ncbi:MAG TPA: zinc-dependent metalloprotease [Acidimicrobiales bacterium]